VKYGFWEGNRRVGEWIKQTEEEQQQYREELRRVREEVSKFTDKRDFLAE
jgi:hypothetical protein